MGGDSCLSGHEFESQHRRLDGLCSVINFNWCFKRPKTNETEAKDGPIKIVPIFMNPFLTASFIRHKCTVPKGKCSKKGEIVWSINLSSLDASSSSFNSEKVDLFGAIKSALKHKICIRSFSGKI